MGLADAEWVAIDEVRYTRPPQVRSAMAKMGRNSPVVRAPTVPVSRPPPPTAVPPAAQPVAPASPRGEPPSASTPPPSLKPGTLRTWSDSSGKFKVEAELVKIEDGQVVLRKRDGSVVRVPLDKLSREDRLFALSQAQ
jgi:hypothetical protein